jgi:hypothetical protein
MQSWKKWQYLQEIQQKGELMCRQSGHHRIMGSQKMALVMMVLDADMFNLDLHIGITSFMVIE